MSLSVNGNEFLELVDELRKRGAIAVSGHGYSATFHAPLSEPEATQTGMESAERRRVDLNESEKEELARLRSQQARFEELDL